MHDYRELLIYREATRLGLDLQRAADQKEIDELVAIGIQIDRDEITRLKREITELRAELAELKKRRPTVEIRQVNDGFALYEAERLVRGGFDRRHTAILWAVDQGLGVKV